MDDPYKYFRIEARELLEQLGKAALELEKGPRLDTVGLMLRYAHTLKGAARVVRQPVIAERAHLLEDLLAPLRKPDADITPAHVRHALSLLDDIARHLVAIDHPAEKASAGPVADVPLVIRAELVDMEALLDGVVETAARVDALTASADGLARLASIVDLLAGRPHDDRDSHSRQPLVEQLRDELRRCQRGLQVGLEGVSRELGDVREAAERLRLVAASAVFSVLERTAHDAAKATDKLVAFETSGGDVRLDAHVLATLQGALIQLVRNAVAHGIETERERLAARKPAAGRVEIQIVRRGRNAVFVCRDDGRGVDLNAVRRAAEQRGTPLPEAADAGELVEVLLRGGISTSSHVNEITGRGVGLDVVRAAVERLDGSVRVETTPSLGTTFELTVPLSLASVDALSADAAGISVAIPLDAIRTTRRVTDSDISRTAQGERFVDGGVAIPFLRLASVVPANASSSIVAPAVAIVIESNGQRAAVGVDRMTATGPMVVRPIPEIAAIDPIVAGASVDARGNTRLVLDPDALINVAHRERAAAAPARPKPFSVLVIDDSLTTRTLEESILELAGYDVDTATSGEEALEAARQKRYQLFLVDVEMPGIDGFTFIERIRADPTLRDIPAILVTSRSSVEDRRRGDAVGAQGYIVKSEFDQGDLLARIRRLVRSHV